MSGPARLAVMHFSNETVRGGAEEHLLTLLCRLDRERFQPYLACTAELASRLEPDLPADVEVLRVELHRPFQPVPALRLARALRRSRIDILHSHMFHSSLAASPVGRLSGVPVIVETPHVRELWRKGWKASYSIDRLVGRFVDRYIAVSAANGAYLTGQKRLSAEKICVIPNGCDVDRYDPAQPASAELRRRLGIDEGDPVLMVLARLEPQKGHRVLLDALPAVRASFPRARLVLVGDGSLRSELEEHTRRLGLEAAVCFAGYQSNTPEWLALADVSVLPSFYEGLPLAAIESQAAGRAVVATAVDGTPEAVVDGATGLTVPPGDPVRLAEAICRLLRDPGLRLGLAAAGRRSVVENFSIGRQVRRTEALYLDAYSRRCPAAGSALSRPGRVRQSVVSRYDR